MTVSFLTGMNTSFFLSLKYRFTALMNLSKGMGLIK